MKYSLRDRLNSYTLRINLIFSFGKFTHSFGNKYNGKLSKVFSLDVGIKNSSWLRRTIETFSALLASFLIQILLKEQGRNPCINLCTNCSLKNSHKLGRGRMLEVSKSSRSRAFHNVRMFIAAWSGIFETWWMQNPDPRSMVMRHGSATLHIFTHQHLFRNSDNSRTLYLETSTSRKDSH